MAAVGGEMHCSGCGEKFGYECAGILIRIVSAIQSKKSGRPIPHEEVFPDGADEKFVCFDCAMSNDLSDVAGVEESGYDFPPEEETDEPNVFGLSSPYSSQ